MVKSREHVTTNGRAVFYACMWNDFRQAALDCGWALGLHGSLNSDMDIMAMAWTQDAKPVEELIKALEKCLTEPKGKISETQRSTDKPNNRVVYTIHIFADFYIDLNVIEFSPSISRERLVEVINETMPCNCIPAYKDRQLSAPDCPNCNYAESIADAILPLLNKEPQEGILVKWIDVKKELPEVGENVLTWNGIGGMHVCYRGYFKDKTDINWKFALDGEPSYYLNITHWAKVTPPKP